MNKIKNIEKKFCLIIGLFGLMLPIIANISCWSFGFIGGMGIAGWLLYPSNEDNEDEE